MIKVNHTYSHWLHGNVTVVHIINNVSCIVKKENGMRTMVASENLKPIERCGVPCPEICSHTMPQYSSNTFQIRDGWFQGEGRIYVRNYAIVDTAFNNECEELDTDTPHIISR